MNEIAPIRRLGVLDQDIVEANPVVFQGELYRFEYIRYACFSRPYHGNRLGNSYFRLVRARDGAELPYFGFGLAMGVAFADGDRLVVTAVDDHNTVRPWLYQIESTDLVHWSESRRLFGGEGWRIHNSTICETEAGRFLIGFECDHPAGLFCMRFLESRDLRSATLLPEALFGPGWTGGPILRFHDGWYYIFHITGGYETQFVWNISRSRDLAHWEPSPRNPILVPDDAEDKRIHPGCIFDAEQIRQMRAARNINVSDMDFCEVDGRLEMIYSWGDQHGHEYYALAACDVTEAQFCSQYF